MATPPLATASRPAFESMLVTCDPDFALPDRSRQSRLPVWVVLAVALTTACATAVATRHV